MIGRKGERGTIQALVDRAVQGHGGTLLLTGDAGIGKTVLLEDGLERAEGRLTTFRATGRESDADLPFRGAGRAPPSHSKRAITSSTGSRSGSLRSACSRRRARQRPVLAVVDDLQWVDEGSRAAILFVARRISSLHVAFLCAARSDEIPEAEVRGLPSLDLAGLRAREASDLLGRPTTESRSVTVATR